MGFFRQAIDLDPTYALAYVGLAECFVVLRVHSWPVAPDTLVSAKAAAAKALDIDDTIAEAHATLGAIRMTAEHDWLGAEQSFRRAIELAPDYATARNWYVNFLAAQWRFDDAIREAQEAVALDPLSVMWRMGVGHMLFLARRYEEAVETELNVLEVEPHFWLATGCSAWRTSNEANLSSRSTLSGESSLEGTPVARGLLGRILALCGHIDEARGI